MSIFAWITIGLLVGKIILMLDKRIPSDAIGLGIIAVLLITGSLSTKDTLSCFSNESVVLIGILSVVVAGLTYSGSIHFFSEKVLLKANRFHHLLIRMTVPVCILSAFISAEAVITLFINVLRISSKRLKIKLSRLLIPVAYACSLGGMCTLLGSPSNLVVANFYRHATGFGMGILAPLIPGLACTIFGLITLVILRHLLPDRESPEDTLANREDYTVELLLPTENDLVGMTVEESKLDDINGGHLVEIIRFDSEVISPVPKDEFLLGGDRLVYSGQINNILELRKTHGLVNAAHHVFNANELDKNRKLQLATIHHSSPMIGQKIKNLDFEDANNVVLVAIARDGNRTITPPRELTLHAGDTLLLEGSKLRPEHFRNNLTFFESEILPTQSIWKTFISTGILLLMVLLSALDIMPLINSCMLAAVLMIISKCCNIKQMQDSINWKLLMVFAGSVCLGKALDTTGVADNIGHLVSVLCHGSNLFALIVIVLLTSTFTELMSNVLCAAIFTPIALHIAEIQGIDPMALSVAVLISCCSTFATPISSNQNILIYGPGGYKFTDFIKIGIPLKLVIFIVTIVSCYLVYDL